MSAELKVSRIDSPLARSNGSVAASAQPRAEEPAVASPRPAKPARTRRAVPREIPSSQEGETPGTPAVELAPAAGSDPYEGAPVRQFNTRLLDPLHRRYSRLVRDLANEDFDTSMTEIVHALLHEGPSTPEQARELVRRFRRVRTS